MPFILIAIAIGLTTGTELLLTEDIGALVYPIVPMALALQGGMILIGVAHLADIRPIYMRLVFSLIVGLVLGNYLFYQEVAGSAEAARWILCGFGGVGTLLITGQLVKTKLGYIATSLIISVPLVSVRQTHIAYGRQLCGSNSLIFDARCVGNLSITSFR
jgi:hypothetical protein